MACTHVSLLASVQRLCVVGSPEELGVWNAAASTCSLEWREGDVWVGELDIAPGPVEFKLVQVSDAEVRACIASQACTRVPRHCCCGVVWCGMMPN